MEVLPKWERIFYKFAGPSCIAYALWEFYRAGQEHKTSMYVSNGWSLLGGERDIIEREWNCYMHNILTVVLWTVGHLVLSHTLVRLGFSEKVMKTIILLYDSLAHFYSLGTRVAVFVSCEILLVFCSTRFGSISIIWILGAVLTTIQNYAWESVTDWTMPDPPNSRYSNFILDISNSYLHIRLVSAAIEVINQRKSLPNEIKNSREHTNDERCSSVDSTEEKDLNLKTMDETEISLLDFASYCMYFPTHLNGPLLTFDEFHRDKKAFFHSKGKVVPGFQTVVFSICRILFWMATIAITTHFMFPNSVSVDLGVMSKLSIAGMNGYFIWYTLYFTMKYVCLFGFGRLACQIDGMSPPALPRCPLTLYRSTDIWKYFDMGYYNFIKRYIYIPMGGSRCGFFRQCLSSIAAFSFIFYWHGGTYSVFLWAAGNWFVIAVEMAVTQLLKSKKGHYLTSLLSPSAKLRLRLLLYVPCHILSGIQLSCFFFSKSAAYVIADITFLSASWTAILMELACLYFCFQYAYYITDRMAVRTKKLK